VARALPSRPVVPVLPGCWLEAGDGLVLSCFDYEVSARSASTPTWRSQGTALVPGRLLAGDTRSLPSQSAEFTAAPDAVSLTLWQRRVHAGHTAAGGVSRATEPPAAAGTVDGGNLAAAAGQVVPAASRDDTLPMLTGVCLGLRRRHDHPRRHGPLPTGRAGDSWAPLTRRCAPPPLSGQDSGGRGQDHGGRRSGNDCLWSQAVPEARRQAPPAERHPGGAASRAREGMISFEGGGPADDGPG